MTALKSLIPMVEAAWQGEPAALDRLLRACQPDIRRYAYRHCLSSDVDDAVQETLLIVVRRLRALRTVAAFPGWLFTVVRRECRRLERRVFGLDALEEIRVEEWLATRSDETLRIDLVQALESLPAHYREVVLLRDFEQLTLHEIAERLALTIAAAKSRLHRARELMREYLIT